MFLHPILLGVGAACVAIPIVIHLLMRRRRKPVRWAAMRFLLEAYKQRQRRVKLEQFLLLAARCLLVALIAMALARPMPRRVGVLGAGSQDLYLLIDTSLASAARGGSGESELAISIERALELLGRLEGAKGDRAALITLGGPAEAVVLPATSDLSLVQRRLRGLVPTDSAMDIAGGLAMVPSGATQDDAPPRTVAVYSAFREGSVVASTTIGEIGSSARLIASPPAAETLGNTGIESFLLLRPVVVTGGGGLTAGAAQVRVGLLRSGGGLDQAGTSSVRVLVLGEGSPREVGSTEVSWVPGQTEARSTVDIDLAGLGAAGRLVLRAEIQPDANLRDDTAWAVLDVREQLRVAVLGTRRFGGRPTVSEFSPSDWLRLALEPSNPASGRGGSEQISVETLDAARVDAGQLAGFDAVIVAEPDRVQAEGWAGLGAFRARGGAVVLAASDTPGAQLWTESAANALGVDWAFERDPVEVNPEHQALTTPTLDGADLLWYLRGELGALAQTVSVRRVIAVDIGAEGSVLLATAGGAPVLVGSGAGGHGREGLVVLLTVAIDLGWTDLPARPLMVPLMQEIVRSGVGRGRSRGVVVAGGRVVAPAGAVELEDRSTSEPRVVAIDPSTGQTRAAVRSGGAYIARNEGGVDVGAVAVQPAAQSGRAATVDRDRVEAWLAPVTTGSVAWTDAVNSQAGKERDDRSAAGPGPGLMLLVGALLIACIELVLASGLSRAGRSAGGTRA